MRLVCRPPGGARSRTPALLGGALLIGAALAWAGHGAEPDAARAQAEATVRYSAGWNIVAAPTGTTLSKASGPIYAFGPDSEGYQALGPGELVGGRAAWVYFPEDTTITLGRSAAEYSRVLAPADQYLLAGNPSSIDTIAISGPDVTAFAYDPKDGYKEVAELAPGHGAFLISRSGGAITLGKAPAGADAEEATRVQAALTDNPADRANFDRLSVVAADLVQNRQYGQVQSVIDDLRAAADDGFRKRGSAPAAPLDKTQLDAEVAVREALARAKAAAAAGDLSGADAAMDAARAAAQTALDDGLTLSHSSSEPSLAYADTTPAGLAQARALVRAGLPLAGAGRKLPDLFFDTLTAQVNGTPLPPLPQSACALSERYSVWGAPVAQANCPVARFYGTVTINGQSAANSTVTAVISGVTCGSGPITASGGYTVDIQPNPGCTTPGASVSFSIGGAPTNQTGTLPATATRVRLDLSITTQTSTVPQVTSTPGPASSGNQPVAFGACQDGRFTLIFLSEAQTSPGVLVDTFQYTASGLAAGSYAIWAAPLVAGSDNFAQSARQVVAGAVGANGAVSGTLSLTTARAASQQSATFAAVAQFTPTTAPTHTPTQTPMQTPQPIAQPTTIYGLELLTNGRCLDATASVPQRQTSPSNPTAP